MMVFCNNFAVTIGNNPLSSGILKKTINSTSFLALFQNFVTENNSQRIELLFREKDGLFLEIVVHPTNKVFFYREFQEHNIKIGIFASKLVLARAHRMGSSKMISL